MAVAVDRRNAAEMGVKHLGAGWEEALMGERIASLVSAEGTP